MNPRKKYNDEDMETEVGAEEETVEVSAEARPGEAVSAETEVVAEAPDEAAEMDTAEEEEEPGAEMGAAEEEEKSYAEADTVTADKEMDVKKVEKVNLKALARDLYQMGLDLGLSPDEAALLTSKTKLPSFISEEGKKEFREGLVEAYQEMLDERLQSLKQKLGVD